MINFYKLCTRDLHLSDTLGDPIHQLLSHGVDARYDYGRVLHLIKKDPFWSYLYARYIIHGRWPEAEEIIKSDVECLYFYARYVIKGRWIEVEPIIQDSGYYSFLYDEYILKGRGYD